MGIAVKIAPRSEVGMIRNDGVGLKGSTSTNDATNTTDSLDPTLQKSLRGYCVQLTLKNGSVVRGKAMSLDASGNIYATQDPKIEFADSTGETKWVPVGEIVHAERIISNDSVELQGNAFGYGAPGDDKNLALC